MRQLLLGKLNLRSPGPTDDFRNLKFVLNADNYVSVLTPLGMMDGEPTLPARYYDEGTKQYAVVCLEFRIERTAEGIDTLMKIYELMNLGNEIKHPRTLAEAPKDADVRISMIFIWKSVMINLREKSRCTVLEGCR